MFQKKYLLKLQTLIIFFLKKLGQSYRNFSQYKKAKVEMIVVVSEQSRGLGRRQVQQLTITTRL